MKYAGFQICAVVVFALVFGPRASAELSDEVDRLQHLESWSETSAVAKQLNAPIVLLIEQRHCGFCQRLKREVFRPFANDATYRERVIFASVLIDFDGPMIELNGRDISGFEFAESFEASTTPTVLFLDHSSNEVQKRLVGYVSGASYNQRFIGKIESAITAASFGG